MISKCFSCKYIAAFTMLFILMPSQRSYSATAGDYRSLTTGNWNSGVVWEKYNGSTWAATATPPASTDGVIEILSGHQVTVSAAVTADQVVVDAGGFLIISSTQALTIANGSGADLIVTGTLTISGTLSQSASSTMTTDGLIVLSSTGTHTLNASATNTINSAGRYRQDGGTLTTTTGHWIVNGIYQHNANNGALPLAVWNSGAVCEITGVTNAQPGNLDQSFHHFTWNSGSQTTKENFGSSLTTINGDFTVTSTGTGSIRLATSGNGTLTVGGNFYFQGGTLFLAGSGDWIINVTGNYVQSGGNFNFTDATSSTGSGNEKLNLTGDFSISSGTLDCSQYTGSSGTKGAGTINLYGNFTQTGGILTETASSAGHGEIVFTKTGTQVVSITGGTISNTINYTVNSASVVNLGSSLLAGGGTFTVASGAGLMIGNTNGITTSGSSGNIQVTGTRSYNTGADYTYNGTSAQNTGNGLPSTVHNFTLNNNSGVTLTNSASISGQLTFTSGVLTTSSDTLILGTGTSTLGSLSRTSGHVDGAFRRWIAASITSNILFPVGTASDYKGANVSFALAPSSGGTITFQFTAAVAGMNGFNIYDLPDSLQTVGYGYWTASSANGFAGGTYSLDLTATNLLNVTNYNALHLIRRNNSSSAWTLSGTHSMATGSNAVPVVHRSLLTSLSQYGIGSPTGPSGNILPVELVTFSGKASDGIVYLNWETRSEVDNHYFTIERSADAIHYSEVTRVPASSSFSFPHYYSTEDVLPLHGVVYYRLSQTDYDGTMQYLGVIVLLNKSTGSVAEIFPNPSDGRMTLRTGNCEGKITVSVFDYAGQKVYSNEWLLHDCIIPVDVGHLPAGSYMVKLENDGMMETKKIIISR